MKTTGTIAYYELLRMLRVKETFWLLLFLPILLIFILGNALSGVFNVQDAEVEPIKLGVVSSDSSNTGAVQLLKSEEMAKWLDVQEYSGQDELKEALDDREIAYGLFIGAGFMKDVTAGKAAKWELYPGFDDMDNLMAQGVLGSVLDRMNFMQSAAIALGAADAAAASDAGASAEAGFVEVVRPDMTGKDYSAIQYYASQMLVMFLLYAGMATGISIVTEKEQYTLDRMYAAPVKPIQILAGKLIGGGAVAIAQAAVIITFTKLVYGVDWGSSYLSLFLACLLVVVGSISIAVLITAFTSSAKTVQMVFTFIIMVMTFLSGGFSPEIGDFMERLGQFTFSHWAAQSFIHLILGSPDAMIRHSMTILGFTAIGLFAVAALFGRKAVSR